MYWWNNVLDILLNRLQNALEQRDWQAIADLDNSFKSTLMRQLQRCEQNPDLAETLLPTLARANDQYQLILETCEQEQNTLANSHNKARRQQKACDSYLACG